MACDEASYVFRGVSVTPVLVTFASWQVSTFLLTTFPSSRSSPILTLLVLSVSGVGGLCPGFGTPAVILPASPYQSFSLSVLPVLCFSFLEVSSARPRGSGSIDRRYEYTSSFVLTLFVMHWVASSVSLGCLVSCARVVISVNDLHPFLFIRLGPRVLWKSLLVWVFMLGLII